MPMLMAEGDRELYRRQQAALVREKEIMKGVPGWEVGVHVRLSDGDLTWIYQAGKSVYNSRTYHTPDVVISVD